MVEQKIAAATGIAVGTRLGGDVDLGKRIEAAMVHAIEYAHANGVTDPEKIRGLMLIARKAVVEGKDQEG